VNVFIACVKRLPLLTVLIPLWVQAEEKVIPKAPDPMGSAGKVIVFLLLTIVLIFALAWLLSRIKGRGFIHSSHGNIKIIESQTLGMKEKIAVIQVGNKQILVGITAQQITHLADLDQPIELAETQGNISFSELLKKAIRQ